MKLRAYAFLLALCGMSGLLLQGCKEDTIINGNLVPAGDEINTNAFDSVSILSKTYYDDTIATSLSVGGVSIYHALGNISSIADPYTGNINAGIYLQVVPPTTSFTFPIAPDSAVLVLPYYTAFGDTTAAASSQTFEVYEVADSTFNKDTIYYNSSNVATKSAIIGTATIASAQSLNDSVSVNGSNRAPHLRIRLSNDYLNRIKAEATSGSATFAGYSAFLRRFPGLYIAPQAGTMGKTLYYFRLDGAGDYGRANIQFYYTDTVAKTSAFFFTSEYAAHYNKIKRDREGNAVTTLYNSTAATDSIFVIHNEPGAAADIRFPFIKNLPKLPINKAELIITQVQLPGEGAMNTFYAPERLFPIGISADGSAYTVLDRFPTSTTEPLIFLDGRRRIVPMPDGKTVYQYVINIPREVQSAIVEEKDVLHLRISGASGLPGAFRLIAGGSTYSDPAYRIKLRIVYSKI